MKESIIVLMGVSGCGKTVVGKALAEKLGVPFLEGDEFHSPENLAKMSSGVPLDDNDRKGWFHAIREAMEAQPGSAIVSCSALKRKHREFLADASKTVRFVHLDGERELLEKRIRSRVGHFFDPKLLDSQLASLEKPAPDEGALAVNVEPSVQKIVAFIQSRLEASDQSLENSS